MELSKASACGGCFALLAGASAAQIEVYVQHGAQPGFYGASIDGAGDVNRDGWVDWIVTGDEDPLLSGDANEVYVNSGLDGSRLLTLHGDDFSEQYGGSVCGLGDVDGDGFPDVAVGDRFSDHNGEHCGRVWVYSGRGGAVLHAFDGSSVFDGFGFEVACAGDVDGDGLPDVLSGSPKDLGYARVFSGRDGSLLLEVAGTGAWDSFAQSLAGLGDVDHDGHGDFAVGAAAADPHGVSSGLVRIYSGADGAVLFGFEGSEAFQGFGWSVGAAGDVDADGCPDLIVGAPEARSAQGTPTGRAWVYSGCDGALLHAFVGTQEFGYFGASVTGLDDVDGDGFGDLAVGAPFEGADGRVHVLSGRDGGSLASLAGTSVEHAFGHDVARAGDMNRDRLGDLLVGAAHVSVEVGYAHAFTSFDRPPPATYCTAKINSAGCTPRMGFAGAPSVWIGARPMTVLAHDVVNQTSGLLTWGFVPDATPFAGGLRCVGGSARVVLPSSGGSPVGVDCSGSFAFAFSDAYLAAHGLGPGHELFVQCFYLDPTHPDGTGVGLTDALRFTFGF